MSNFRGHRVRKTRFKRLPRAKSARADEGRPGLTLLPERALITPFLENSPPGARVHWRHWKVDFVSGTAATAHISHVPDAARNIEHLSYNIMSDRPTHEAARRADVAALRRELAKGVSPNALDSDGWTPLHYLCISDDDAAQIVPNTVNGTGHTGPRRYGAVACVRMLIDAGAEINAPAEYPTKGRCTPLLYAAGDGNANVVAALLEACADVNRGNAFGETPLHWACCRMDSDVEHALLLIRNGAAVNARSRLDETPLDRAISWKSRRLFPILLRAGAALPAETDNAYIQKVIAAGGFETYKRIHLDALAATFAPHFAHLPPEIVRLVVEYAFHVGDY